ncbi:hypothetical protein ZTR_05221 [Talaromyces verruculosus]|nr:hypothetical protein ZTR_05221 [Talaromyces verruculosus]
MATSNAAAKHSDKALIGSGKANNNAEITRYYTSHQLGWWHKKPFYFCKDIDWHQLPLAIHMGCWKLVQWQLGPSIENNLELFIAIILRISTTSLSILKGETYDAYRIAQVQELIEASRVSKKRKRKGRYFGFSRFLLLPTELLEIVLDHLTCKEITKLEIAMGFLVADRYWRRRAAVFLVEMDEIADEDLDWRHVCRKWERISNGELFRDHRYIVGILRDQVKPTYMENLKERVFPSLKEVIAGM